MGGGWGGMVKILGTLEVLWEGMCNLCGMWGLWGLGGSL